MGWGEEGCGDPREYIDQLPSRAALGGRVGAPVKLFVNDNDEYSPSSISHCHILIMTYVVDDIYC